MTHIGGISGEGRARARRAKQLKQHPAKLFICGHSHILKVRRRTRHFIWLHMKSRAHAGQQGWHKVKTHAAFLR